MRLNVREFLSMTADEVQTRIARHFQQSGGFDVSPEQAKAWEEEITILRLALSEQDADVASRWTIFFEYKPPRMARWLDVVLLLDNRIVVIEFKVGCAEVLAADLSQTRD